MINVKRNPKKTVGASWLIYSTVAPSGKTFTTLKTARKPMVFMNVEHRDSDVVLNKLGDSGKTIKVLKLDRTLSASEMFEDLVNTLTSMCVSAENGKFKYKVVFFDSLSYYVNIEIVEAIEKENKDAELFDTDILPLSNSKRMNWEGFNFLGSHTLEVVNLLTRLTESGVHVIVSAHGKDELISKPLFVGNKFSDSVKHIFDYIGFIKPRYNEKGIMKFPAGITFCSENSITRSASGLPDKQFIPFDWNVIFKTFGF